MPTSCNNRNTSELSTFEKLWKGGYYEGDVYDPIGGSSYGQFGYLSVLYAVYICCIKPYINSKTIALEIGPGRGAWTKTLLGAKEIWCLDAKPREANGIDEFLGFPKNLIYHQITDFSCRELPNDKFDYLFSFGALCHTSWTGIVQYANNLFPKLRKGANAFIMVADYDKANRLCLAPASYNVISRERVSRVARMLRGMAKRIGFYQISGSRFSTGNSLEARLLHLAGKLRIFRSGCELRDKDEDQVPREGRWFHAGIERTASMLRDAGYVVKEKDVCLVHRDPIIHFVKPE